MDQKSPLSIQAESSRYYNNFVEMTENDIT